MELFIVQQRNADGISWPHSIRATLELAEQDVRDVAAEYGYTLIPGSTPVKLSRQDQMLADACGYTIVPEPHLYAQGYSGCHVRIHPMAMTDPLSVYLVRQDIGAREDYWPLSAHLTPEGAEAAFTGQLNERFDHLERKTHDPYDGKEHELPHAYTGDRCELFVAELKAKD